MEFLRDLPPDWRVLDLGSRGGSFDDAATGATAIRVDLEPHRARNFVQADAARLPFRDGSIDVVVANHSLEHIEQLDAALAEIGRVARRRLFVAVPDASTWTDRIYRWLGRGGGHVNAFTSAAGLQRRIEAATGFAHAATVTLHSGLSFLHRANNTRPPRRLMLLGGGRPALLRRALAVARWCDRRWSTRLAVYGWAMYFGDWPTLDLEERRNVCIRCGAGHRAEGLARRYRCPACGEWNLRA